MWGAVSVGCLRRLGRAAVALWRQGPRSSEEVQRLLRVPGCVEGCTKFCPCLTERDLLGLRRRVVGHHSGAAGGLAGSQRVQVNSRQQRTWLRRV